MSGFQFYRMVAPLPILALVLAAATSWLSDSRDGWVLDIPSSRE